MNLKKSNVLITLGILTMSGCSIQEGYRSYETAEVNNNGVVENRLVEEYVGPDKKRVVTKQVMREETQCIGQDGRPLPAKSVSACMKKKGKIVDKIYHEEKVTRSR